MCWSNAECPGRRPASSGSGNTTRNSRDQPHRHDELGTMSPNPWSSSVRHSCGVAPLAELAREQLQKLLCGQRIEVIRQVELTMKIDEASQRTRPLAV